MIFAGCFRLGQDASQEVRQFRDGGGSAVVIGPLGVGHCVSDEVGLLGDAEYRVAAVEVRGLVEHRELPLSPCPDEPRGPLDDRRQGDRGAADGATVEQQGARVHCEGEAQRHQVVDVDTALSLGLTVQDVGVDTHADAGELLRQAGQGQAACAPQLLNVGDDLGADRADRGGLALFSHTSSLPAF